MRFCPAASAPPLLLVILALLCLLSSPASAAPQPVGIANGGGALLWNNSDGNGAVELWTGPSGNTYQNHYTYGPYTGWSALALAAGSDGVPRILWTKTDGSIALWRIDGAGGFTHAEYGPYAGWTAIGLAVGGDSAPRILWTHAPDNQMSLWRVAADGGFTHTEYGPYTGYTAALVAAGPNNVPRILWNKTDGSVSLWNGTTDAAGFGHAEYGPYSGYAPLSLAVDSANTPRLLWSHPADGTVSLWSVAPDGSVAAQNYVDPAGASPIGVGADLNGAAGASQVLYTQPDGTALIDSLASSSGGSAPPRQVIVPPGAGSGSGGGSDPAPTPADPNPHGSYVLVNYSGGSLVSSDGTNNTLQTGSSSDFDTTTYSGVAKVLGVSNPSGGSTFVSAKLTGPVYATFHWTPDADHPNSPPPAQVTVIQQCKIGWDLYDPTNRLSVTYNNGFTPQKSSSVSTAGDSGTGIGGVTISSPGVDLTVPYAISADISGYSSYVCSYSHLYFSFAASIPTINLVGPTRDPKNNTDNILVGQGCTASVSNIPTSLLPTATYQWKVSGKTFQSWTATYSPAIKAVPGPPPVPAKAASSTATFVAGPGPLNNPTAHWFWSDKKSTPKVDCTVTITPPANQGTPFTMVAPTQAVNLIRPKGNIDVAVGIVTLNNQYLKDHPGYWLYLGPADQTQHHGIEWDVTINKPPAPFPSAPLGVWNFVQVSIPHRYETPIGGAEQQSPYFGVSGLDGTYPYGLDNMDAINTYGRASNTFDADGAVHSSSDSPGILLTNDVAARIAPSDSFNNYIMYTPPGAVNAGTGVTSTDVAWVPLYDITWSWSANASRSASSDWSTVTPGGNVPTPQHPEQYVHPQWTTINQPVPAK